MLTRDQKEYAALTAELVGQQVAAQLENVFPALDETMRSGEEIPLPLNSNSVKLENSRVVKAGEAVLYGFSGFNNKASAQFIQAFDSAVLPADGAVPVYVLSAPATGNFFVYWGDTGRVFRAGIVLCNSSTIATKTIGSPDCWFDAQYT